MSIITIGEKTYNSNKEVKQFYSNILNSYEANEYLNEEDFNHVLDLLDYYFQKQNIPEPSEKKFTPVQSDLFEEEEKYINDVRIILTGYNSKTFQFLTNDNKQFNISYLKLISSKEQTPLYKFQKSCRNTIQADLIKIKRKYFDEHSVSSKAPCQESGIYYGFTELVVDHRQPHSLSSIIDRFIEINNVNVEDVKYKDNKRGLIIFENDELSRKFREYHKEKSYLRIVHKKLNSARSTMARIKQSSKDLRVE